jgi:hypothetical protein
MTSSWEVAADCSQVLLYLDAREQRIITKRRACGKVESCS